MGVGDDFEGPFAPEDYEVTPETDELFVHASQLLDKSCEGLLSQVSQYERAKNWKRLLQASQQYAG